MRQVPRVLAGAAFLAVVVYPVAAFLRLSEIPLLVRIAWLAMPIAAWQWPIGALLGFLVAAPLVPTLPMWFRWPAIAPAEILFFGLLIPALCRTALGWRPWQPRTPTAAALLAVVVTASMVVVISPFRLGADGIWPLLRQIHDFAAQDFIVAQSQIHLFGSLIAWAIAMEGLALMWLVLSERLGDIERGLARILGAAAIGAAIVAALGIVQWWTGEGLLTFWRIQNPNITRINATFTDVNGLGSYLAMMVPIALGLSMREEGARRGLWRGAAALMMIAVLFTASRAAWVALAIGLTLHGIAVWRFQVLDRSSWWGRHVWHVVAGATAAMVLSVGVLSAYATARDVRYYDEDSYLETFLYTVNLRAPAQERMKGRLAFWAAATTMIADRPAFGIGVGKFFKDVSRYAPDPQALPRTNENAHNYFLQIAAELGVVGFAVFLAVIGLAFVPALKVAASSDQGAPTRHLALAVAVAMAIYLLTWSTGHPLLVREGQFAFWPIVGVAYGFGALGGRDRRSRWSSRAMGILAALVVLSVPVRAIREEARVDLTRHTSGLHDVEVGPDGHQFRWTRDRALFYVPGDARMLEFDLRSIAPFEQSVDVILDGTVADRLTLRDRAWHPERYPIPRRQRAPRYRRVELVVHPVWTPAGDPRTLGVQLKDQRWQW